MSKLLPDATRAEWRADAKRYEFMPPWIESSARILALLDHIGALNEMLDDADREYRNRLDEETRVLRLELAQERAGNAHLIETLANHAAMLPPAPILIPATEVGGFFPAISQLAPTSSQTRSSAAENVAETAIELLQDCRAILGLPEGAKLTEAIREMQNRLKIETVMCKRCCCDVPRGQLHPCLMPDGELLNLHPLVHPAGCNVVRVKSAASVSPEDSKNG